MTSWTLASRFIARRRSILRAGLPLGLAAFIAATGAAVLATVTSGEIARERATRGDIARTVRFSDAAEASSFLTPAPGSDPTGADGTFARSSRVVVSPGIAETDGRSEPVAVWFAHIESELEFLDPVETAESELRLFLPGGEIHTRGFRVVLDSTNVVLVPAQVLSSGPPEVPTLIGVERVRRTSAGPALTEAGFFETDWQSQARARLRPIRLAFAGAALALTIAGAVAMAAAVWIAWRRYQADFALLGSLGHSRGYIVRLLMATGGITAAVSGVAGTLASLVLLAVLNLRGGVSLTPLLSIAPQLQSVTGAHQLMSSVSVDVAVIAIAFLIGALTALPSARQAGKIADHQTPWR